MASQCHPERSEGSVSMALLVTLSTFATLSVNSAKGLSRRASRCFAALSMTGFLSMTVFACHPERSEGSVSMALLVTPFTSFRASSERSEGSVATDAEMLRCAQHDRAVLLPRHRQRSAFRLLSPPSPLQHVLGFSSVDAYWGRFIVPSADVSALHGCSDIPIKNLMCIIAPMGWRGAMPFILKTISCDISGMNKVINSGNIDEDELLIGRARNPPRADTSALGTINRPLRMAGFVFNLH